MIARAPVLGLSCASATVKHHDQGILRPCIPVLPPSDREQTNLGSKTARRSILEHICAMPSSDIDNQPMWPEHEHFAEQGTEWFRRCKCTAVSTAPNSLKTSPQMRRQSNGSGSCSKNIPKDPAAQGQLHCSDRSAASQTHSMSIPGATKGAPGWQCAGGTGSAWQRARQQRIPSYHSTDRTCTLSHAHMQRCSRTGLTHTTACPRRRQGSPV